MTWHKRIASVNILDQSFMIFIVVNNISYIQLSTCWKRAHLSNRLRSDSDSQEKDCQRVTFQLTESKHCSSKLNSF